MVVADMLAGFDGFKSSLPHEYQAIIADFRGRLALDDQSVDDGPAMVELVEQAYSLARSKEARLRMTSKHPVPVEIVKTLFHRRTDRGMSLSPWTSRCIRAGELQEIVTTTDQPSQAGDRVDAVGFLGFVRFDEAAVLERGDQLWHAGRLLGIVAGFDECHAPNHYNVLITVPELVTAEDLDLRPGDILRFTEQPCRSVN
jgi:hypothetical protein